MFTLLPYTPLDTLKPFADDIWIVDGRVVQMRYPFVPGFYIPFTTRMTVVRLPAGELWVHSPTSLTDGLKAELAALGPVRWLVAPNRLHYSFLAEWQRAWPDAETWVAPGMEPLAAQQGFCVDHVLDSAPPKSWSGTLDQVLVPGIVLTEAVFFHRSSATLIVTDLIQSFEAQRIRSRWLRFLTGCIGGVLYPQATTPRDLRLTFLGHTQDVRRAAQTMIAWMPERIVIAHGPCFMSDGTAALRRALSWALPAAS